MSLLVFGVRSGSLGEAIVAQAAQKGWTVVTAGINGEDYFYDADYGRASDILSLVRPDAVVCTIGINDYSSFDRHLRINCAAPIDILDDWLKMLREGEAGGKHLRQYVAISSNSAHIARTQSAAYCASKAALSMALRVRARECARQYPSMVVYGYEPGLIEGTPMTEEVNARLFGNVVPVSHDTVPLHRMPGIGPNGLPRHWLAEVIVANLAVGVRAYNGTLIRLDAGEQ